MDAYPGPRPPAGSITIEREGTDRRVLCLRGDVDTAVATRFTSSQGRERVVVDAIDAGARDVHQLLRARPHAALRRGVPSPPAGTPCCARRRTQVDRALQLAGIDSRLPAAGAHRGAATGGRRVAAP